MEEEKKLKRTANATQKIYDDNKQETTDNNNQLQEDEKVNSQQYGDVVGDFKKTHAKRENPQEETTPTEATKPITTVETPPAEKTEQQSAAEIYKPYFDAEDKRLEAEQKRARRKKLFAGISDGISAIANLYAVSQGAPNQFNPQSTLSAKAAERYDNITKERNSNKLAYNNIMYQARRTDKDFDVKRVANEISRQRLGLDQAKAVADANYQNAMANLKAKEQELNDKKFELDKQLKDQQISKATYDAEIARVKAEYQPKIENAQIALTNARTAQAKASKEYTQKRTKTIGKERVIDYKYEKNADDLNPRVVRRRERYVSPTDGNDEEIKEWSGE